MPFSVDLQLPESSDSGDKDYSSVPKLNSADKTFFQTEPEPITGLAGAPSWISAFNDTFGSWGVGNVIRAAQPDAGAIVYADVKNTKHGALVQVNAIDVYNQSSKAIRLMSAGYVNYTLEYGTSINANIDS